MALVITGGFDGAHAATEKMSGKAQKSERLLGRIAFVPTGTLDGPQRCGRAWEHVHLGHVRADLLTWYRASRRDLPWRRKKDAYSIWISEVMLQQTRVETVIPYYERFLARWPTVSALAGADPDEVRAAWSGLGYYRRAELMLRAAKVVASDHNGAFPREPELLRELPGFGAYTAGAVASIAFDRAAPAVDGNVQRVLARVAAIEGTRAEVDRAAAELAAKLAPGESPGEWTQALMELGALICTSKPRCSECPIAQHCSAFHQGSVDRIPPARKRPERPRLEMTALIVLHGHAVLLEKRPETGLFAKLWCPPLFEGHLSAAAPAFRTLDIRLGAIAPVAITKHVLTHREISLSVFRATSAQKGRFTAVKVSELDKFGVPSFTTRTLKAGLPPEMLAGVSLPGRARSRK